MILYDKIPRPAANAILIIILLFICGCECGTLGDSDGDNNSTTSRPSYMGWELDETNTGLAGAGIDKNSLPLYTGTDTPPYGTVITEQKITTCLILVNGNITIERCWIQPEDSYGVGSLVFTYNPYLSIPSDYSSTIVDCDIDGTAISNDMVYADGAIRGLATVQRCNIYGMGSGILIFDRVGIDALIEENYVHDLRGGMFGSPPQQSHNESATIRIFIGSSLIFRNNRLESKTGSDSGALFIQAWAGSIDNVLIEGNLFDTYGWCIPLEANANGYGSHMDCINNRFTDEGYGPGYISGGTGWNEWSENYFNDPAMSDNKGAVAEEPVP